MGGDYIKLTAAATTENNLFQPIILQITEVVTSLKEKQDPNKATELNLKHWGFFADKALTTG